MPILFLLFIVIPIAEIFTIIQVNDWIGGWNTVGLMVLSAFAGATLLRTQGLATLVRLQEKAAEGELPSTELLEALVLFFGGALMVTPGFLTDGFGLLLLVRPFRLWLIAAMLSRWWQQFASKVQSGQGSFYYTSRFTGTNATNDNDHPINKVATGRDGHDIIEGDFREVDDDKAGK